jgi:ankyrin repeat protein
MEFFLHKRYAYVNWLRLFDPDKPPWQERVIAKSLNSVASPLYYASLVGLVESARLLLEAGADINAQGGWYGNALQTASHGCHDQIVQQLLEKGADVNARTDNGETALQCAATYAHEITVKLLLEKGVDIAAGARSLHLWDHEETALHRAAANGREMAARLLLVKGADVNARTKNGETALHQAASEGHEVLVAAFMCCYATRSNRVKIFIHFCPEWHT